MPLTIRLHHSGVSGMKNLFDKKVEKHIKTQLDNPFSEWEGAGQNKHNFSKDDESYGRPLPGSDSERRAQAAQYHIMMDIKYLCNMIWDCAEWQSPDGRAAITFGKLFNLYNAINDKVVGTLLRGRKYGFLYFEGEMLYQRRDDDKVIELNRNINTIRSRFGMPPLESGGGEVEKWGDLVEDSADEENENKENYSSSNENGEENNTKADLEDISDNDKSSNYLLNDNETVIEDQQIAIQNNVEDETTEIYGNCNPNFIIEINDNSDEAILQEEKSESRREILPVQNYNILSPLDVTIFPKDFVNDDHAELSDNEETEKPTFTTAHGKALQADIVSILGQFACNLAFLRSSKGSIDSEIKNTANKIFRLLSTK